MKRLSIGYRHAGEGPGGGAPLPAKVFWDKLFTSNKSYGKWGEDFGGWRELVALAITQIDLRVSSIRDQTSTISFHRSRFRSRTLTSYLESR